MHPAAGSHANFYGESLYLGSSAEQGVGCDDTRGPTFDIRPAVQTIPSDPAQARADFPWIAFEGRWGELQPAFFNGPTGPNLKTQWTRADPLVGGLARRAATRSPAAARSGPAATDFFCGAVAGGSRALVRLVDQPLAFGLVLAGLALLVVVLLSRATWRPTAPLRLARRRSWGQILLGLGARCTSSGSCSSSGSVSSVMPISLLVTLLQALVLHATSILGVQTGGESNGLLALPRPRDRNRADAARPRARSGRYGAGAGRDRRGPAGRARRRLPPRRRTASAPLFGALLVASVVVSLLASSIFLIPIAVWLAGRWALIAPAIELEDALGSRRPAPQRPARAEAMAQGRLADRRRRSPRRRRRPADRRAADPRAPTRPFWLVNVIAGLVYAVAMPFVALTTAYVYFDARTRARARGESASRRAACGDRALARSTED